MAADEQRLRADGEGAEIFLPDRQDARLFEIAEDISLAGFPAVLAYWNKGNLKGHYAVQSQVSSWFNVISAALH